MVTQRPSAGNNCLFGGTVAPPLSHIHGESPNQKPLILTWGPRAAPCFKSGPGSDSRNPASLLAWRGESSTLPPTSTRFEGSAGHRTPGPFTISCSSRLGSPPFGSKRGMHDSEETFLEPVSIIFPGETLCEWHVFIFSFLFVQIHGENAQFCYRHRLCRGPVWVSRVSITRVMNTEFINQFPIILCLPPPHPSESSLSIIPLSPSM